VGIGAVIRGRSIRVGWVSKGRLHNRSYPWTALSNGTEKSNKRFQTYGQLCDIETCFDYPLREGVQTKARTIYPAGWP